MSIANAAANNAEWCAIVASTHGLAGAWHDDAWSCAARTPPFYPDAVTLRAAIDVAALLDRIDATAGCSVKDSFASVDLRPHGFRVLFDAQWITRPMPAADPGPEGWERVADAAALGRWVRAWAGPEADGPSPFRAELLDHPDVAIVGRTDRRDGGANAGLVLNRTNEVVGVSNVFSTSGPLDATWAAIPGLAAATFPDATTLCGYESGPDLALATGAAFTPAGALRVCGSTLDLWADVRPGVRNG